MLVSGCLVGKSPITVLRGSWPCSPTPSWEVESSILGGDGGDLGSIGGGVLGMLLLFEGLLE